MKKRTIFFVFFLLIVILSVGISAFSYQYASRTLRQEVFTPPVKSSYWFMLQRKSNIEKLYEGIPGDENRSRLLKEFTVKTGRPGERPTPLPQLLGKEYWVLTDMKEDTGEETAPYFLTLDVPVKDTEPFGPEPYLECNGQCNWVTPGPFGLHGTAGNSDKLSEADPGSSGCIRHSDEDITYLYNLLKGEKNEIRYYIQDV